MSQVRVSVSMSVDGYVAGPEQSREHPLGLGGGTLHEWAFATRTFRSTQGLDGEGALGLDDIMVARSEEGIGATVMGRNMFGPVRGEWHEPWDGWWGTEPPFHHPVFVLTHHPRPPIVMAGGTTFHFVADGVEAALDLARTAADGRDVRIGGGASTIQQFLRRGLVDEMHLVVVPVFLGAGERLFEGLDGGPRGLDCVEVVASTAVSHIRFVRRSHPRLS